MSMIDGRPPSGQALAVPATPLRVDGPAGFDPSRSVILGRLVSDKKAVSATYCHRVEDLDDVMSAVEPYGKLAEYTVAPRGFEENGKDWLQRTIDKAAHHPWVSRASLAAIATEAQRATDSEAGVVHEGAGLKGIAQGQQP